MVVQPARLGSEEHKKTHHNQNLVKSETSKNSTNKCRCKEVSPLQEIGRSSKKLIGLVITRMLLY